MRRQTRYRARDSRTIDEDPSTPEAGLTIPETFPQPIEALAAAPQRADILNSLAANIALLDATGMIIAVNESWRRYAAAAACHDPDCGLGKNYLTVCDEVEGVDSLPACRAATGIRAVIHGEVDQFSMEYVMESPAGEAWFLLVVTPVGSGAAIGATVMHLDITARKRHETDAWRFAAAMDALADGVFLIDRVSMTTTYANDAGCRIYGMSREALLSSKPWEVLGAGRLDLEVKYDRIVAQDGQCEPEETVWVRPDGTQIDIELRRHSHCLDGTVSIVVLARDVTARKIADSRIRHLNRVHAILSGINSLIVRANDRRELFREACRIAVEQGGFMTCWVGILDPGLDRLVPVASAGMNAAYRDAVAESLLHGYHDELNDSYVVGALRNKQIRVCNDNARPSHHVLASEYHEAHGIRSFAILPLIVDDDAVGVLALYTGEVDFFHDDEIKLLIELAGDVSFAIDHIEKQERLAYLAHYDALTGLPNRRLYIERLAQYVRAAGLVNRKMAVCIVDLERFRNINDSLGRPAGDCLLRLVAEWLVNHVAEAALLGRLDSDHFAITLPDVDHEDAAARTVETLIDAFVAHSFPLSETVYRMAVKVGIAMFPDDGDDAEALFKNAGAALTKAKVGGDRYLFYAQRMTETVAGRLGMENQLRLALEREEFALYYQPKVGLASGRMVGVEALLRWNNPRTGIVAPALFIPVLEETGLIIEVGRWVLRKAIDDHLRWRRSGYPSVRIAVNVSPLQLRQSRFVDDIREFTATNAAVANGLELEITESLIMEDVKFSIAALQVIREIGVKIAIDDFGTGYSSLSYLAKLPVDTLKIDRSFIFDMDASESGMLLVSSIINLAHSLKLNVVAEGVETAEQAQTLNSLKCDEAQGYFYSKPMTSEALEEKYLKPVIC